MPNQTPAAPPRPDAYDKQVALVLQGGGALGSYQAGVYEALAGSDYLPDWVPGISIGATGVRRRAHRWSGRTMTTRRS